MSEETLNSLTALLQKENNYLHGLVTQLSQIILRSVTEHSALPPQLQNAEVPSATRAALSAIEIIARLREAAVFCARASRESADNQNSQKLESLSVELADAAQRLAAVFVVTAEDSESEDAK
jgi:hypothetical protein